MCKIKRAVSILERDDATRCVSSLSLSKLSLSRLVTEQSAQNVMIFCRWKSDKSQMRKKKLANDTSVFFICAPPQNNSLLPKTRNNNETEYS